MCLSLPTKEKKMKQMRRAIELLISVLIFSFSLYYYDNHHQYSYLPCSLHSITSLLRVCLRNFTTRKAMFLLAHAILLFLSKGFTRNVDDHLLQSQPASDDEYIAGNVDDQLSSLQCEHVVGLQVLHPVEKRVIEESVALHSSSYVSTKTFGDIGPGERLLSLSESVVVEDELVVEMKALGGSTTECLEVVLVEEEGNNTVQEEGMELVIVDKLELLAIDELNKRFDEFIVREKRKRRMEALQLIMV